MNAPMPQSLREFVRSADRRVLIVLLWAPLVLVVWRIWGGAAFYLARLAPAVALPVPVGTAAEWYTFGSAFALLGVATALLGRRGLGMGPADLGVRIGDWRWGLKAVAFVAPVMILLTIPAARNPQFLAQYPLDRGACRSASAFVVHALVYFVYYAGWEFFFRGFMQEGLRPALGDVPAILVQTAISCLVHIGKPDGEVFAALAGGLVFGWIALRSRSILYVLILHWLLGITLDFLICFT